MKLSAGICPGAAGGPEGLRLAVGSQGGGAFVVVVVVSYLDVSENNGKGEGFVKVSPAFGLLLYAAGVVVIAVGVVWLWMDRSRTQK